MFGSIKKLRHIIGVVVFDLWRYLYFLNSKKNEWITASNRTDEFEKPSDGVGVRVKGLWTSELHAPKIIPYLGLRLMRKAFDTFPVLLDDSTELTNNATDADVSIIIGHRGQDRLPHLMSTLLSVTTQRGVNLECIVVEQSVLPELKGLLPSWVRYQHSPLSDSNRPYSRSWAFNVGARLAKGSLLIFHDNDLLIPHNYVSDHYRHFCDGYAVINLKRFIFYLSESASNEVFEKQKLVFNKAPDKVLQNALGGGSIAISKKEFFNIGGFDEAFIGWGGEDNELWQRALMCRVYSYAYLPLIHLWHKDQSGKRAINGKGRLTAKLTEERLAIAPQQRIEELRKRDFGNPYHSCVAY